MNKDEALEYLRIGHLPTVWCPGCGNGIVLKAMLEAIKNLGLQKSNIAVVSGIGCSSRATGYIDFNTMHTLHGRAIAFATGVKLARPDLKVIVITGDGDAMAIGGNHFIHACRRNMDLTIIVYNNNIYGMTGGQYSPTTPFGDKATTAPYGNLEKPFDIVEMAKTAGATYIARATTYHYMLMVKYIQKAIAHEGTSVIDAITQCPTYYGRYNKSSDAPGMMQYFKDNSINVEKAKTLSQEELAGKIIIGEFVEVQKSGYVSEYAKLRERLKVGS
ncbi:2-oxoacid:ferredoxin oxidoreductase subunit beta [Athalassotoga saccharophila]|uniref:2-oxoacid:ferredoxin oxidoreductase subunit beta n=1 Tax=Athalassotoga saccharophila TaxID=1441386 RepID=UPI00137B21C0|nr:2-oxoacid:ferredoxin oxidoreductase subunit beta [Athalassotoga saccharophila]BBJ27244.1 2-oxoglutarate/2-oxoacid ferredoxin oxidoreductase, beta subunit [Athalassotoga saccharophila]